MIMGEPIFSQHHKAIKHKKEVLTDAMKVKKYADYYSEYYRIPKLIVYRIIEAESDWRHDNLRSKRFKASSFIGDDSCSFGPMQDNLYTSRAIWNDSTITALRLLHDVAYNINTGCKILESEFFYFRTRLVDMDKIWLMVITSYNRGRPTTLKLKKPNNYAYRVYFGLDDCIAMKKKFHNKKFL